MIPSSVRRGWGDIGLAVVVAGVVAMMVVPLPRLVLDLLVTLSLTAAIVTLLAAVYSTSAQRLTTFPAVLLVSTVFRLGINVSTTRRILAEGDAGEVVGAFGSLVAGADLVVGLVVFSVITIVQYVVVARGAERVAEVAARFALDGLPGKQLAIDADLRAGGIDVEEARRLRGELERQSQMYGALDGAMKFVKGDAIAAILIVGINLVAGMTIGMVERGMDVRAAAETYAILSIGDGLVVQLPALLMALAAALLVSRVSSPDGERAIGEEIATQLGADPRSFLTAAGLLLALGLVPGLPMLPFWVLGAIAGGIGLVIRAGIHKRRKAVADASGVVAESEPEPEPIADGIELALAPETAALFAADAWVERELARVRARVFERLGVRLPAVWVRSEAAVARGEIEFRLWGVTVDWLPLAADVEREFPEVVEQACYRHAAEMVRASSVQRALDTLGAGQSSLVREVVPKIATLPTLVEVLRRLVREGVSIRDLAAVLEGLAQAPVGGPRDAAFLAEVTRANLQRAVTGSLAPRGKLAAWTVDPMIEEAIRGAIVQRDGGAIVALEPDLARDIVAAVRRSVGERGVVLASGDVRRHLRTVLAPEIPGVVVVAPHELRPEVIVRTQGRIDVG